MVDGVGKGPSDTMKSPLSIGRPSPSRNNSHKASTSSRLFQLLQLANKSSSDNNSRTPIKQQQKDPWDEQAILSAIAPTVAAYCHPDTLETPLHIVMHLFNTHNSVQQTSKTTTNSVSSTLTNESLLTVASELIRVYPEAMQAGDAAGHIPLHYAIAPPPPSCSSSHHFNNDATMTTSGEAAMKTDESPEHGVENMWPASSWKVRTAMVRLLLSSDVTNTSAIYLTRHNVDYSSQSGFNPKSSTGSSAKMPEPVSSSCSPLYRVVETIPDDSTPSHAPTLEYLHLVLKALVTASATTISSLNDDGDGKSSTTTATAIRQGTPLIGVGNASDGDKPLALLYRRFTRQFDLAEKFFAGDNSRPEVVEHRRNYKTAAGNTWKMMEMLLKQQLQQHDPAQLKTVFRTVHRAVQGETPPDLLRYIVETNAEDLTVPDEAGNLPLHYAARYQRPLLRNLFVDNNDTKNSAFPAFYSKYVMDELLYKYPEAASKPDAAGLFPLTLAVQSGKLWIGGGVKSLYDAYPEALQQIQLTEHPALRRALSMDQHNINAAAMAAADDETKEKTMDIIRDEQHDAIMLVQDEKADVSEVVTSMWAHEEDAGVQMLGCVAISRLLLSAEQNQRQSSSLGACLRIALTAVPSVVNAMKAHPNEVIVQEKACHALKVMAAVDGQREVSFVASGAVATIVGAMQAHVSDPGVQEQACGALGRILHYGGSDRATVVASVSGVTALINALAAHPTVCGVQSHACRALCELTNYQDVANLPDVPRMQTEPLLLVAQNNFPDDCTEAVTVLMTRLS